MWMSHTHGEALYGAQPKDVSRNRELGAEGFIVRADGSRPDELSGMVGRVREKFGTLNRRCNNALGDLSGFMNAPLRVRATIERIII